MLSTFGSFIGTHIHTQMNGGPGCHIPQRKHTQVKIHFITLDSYFQYITRGIKGKSALASLLGGICFLHTRRWKDIAGYPCILVCVCECAFHTKKRINKDPSERKITVMCAGGGAVAAAWWFAIISAPLVGGCFFVFCWWRFLSCCFFWCFCFLCIKSA